MPGSVFLGLVTHPRTRFTEAASPAGLIPSLQALLEQHGVKTQVAIHKTDDWTQELLNITRAVIEESIDAELDIEKRWRHYIDPSVPHWFLNGFMGVRRIYRRWKFLPRAGKQPREEDAGFRMVRRLINIELAHMSLLKQASSSDCEWTLIAEDDAITSNVDSFALALESFISERSSETQPKYVNVSRSFNHRRLRVGELLQPIGTWGAPESHIQILEARRPITNTVCAIFYRNTFLTELYKTMQTIPLAPVVPIDWKLNEAIMQLHNSKQLVSGDCWILEPAPIVQSSMVD